MKSIFIIACILAGTTFISNLLLLKKLHQKSQVALEQISMNTIKTIVLIITLGIYFLLNIYEFPINQLIIVIGILGIVFFIINYLEYQRAVKIGFHKKTALLLLFLSNMWTFSLFVMMLTYYFI